jgi:hypothetical protein
MGPLDARQRKADAEAAAAAAANAESYRAEVHDEAEDAAMHDEGGSMDDGGGAAAQVRAAQPGYTLLHLPLSPP